MRFQDQLSLHFQMLIQSLALSGEIVGADQAWVTTLKMMVRPIRLLTWQPLRHA